ncbi:MAG: hypothetical protein ABIH86_05580 [Planctomycetota bacterium]
MIVTSAVGSESYDINDLRDPNTPQTSVERIPFDALLQQKIKWAARNPEMILAIRRYLIISGVV